MTTQDIETEIASLAPTYATAVMAARPVDRIEAMAALVEAMTASYPSAPPADAAVGAVVICRHIGATVITFAIRQDPVHGASAVVELSGAVEEAFVVHSLAALEYNTHEWIAQAMRRS